MKIMFASDIHGSGHHCERLIERYKAEKADRLVLLGDLLYHGPRNQLPEGHGPQRVAELLNGLACEILCVRGNCDAEIDQALLEFDIMADYFIILDGGRIIFVTHGHLYSPENLPALKPGDVLINGHTHIHAAEKQGDIYYVNPGSAALPKGGQVNSYMVFENSEFIIKDLDGNALKQLAL